VGGSGKALSHPLFNIRSDEERNLCPRLELLRSQPHFHSTPPQQNDTSYTQFANTALKLSWRQLPLRVAALMIKQETGRTDNQELSYLGF
jgi:hypothetical protein